MEAVVPATNVGLRLDAMADLYPDKPSLILPAARGSDQCVITFAQMRAVSDAIARGLAASGIQRGMRACLMASPSIEFFALSFALVRAGVSVVMVDPGIGLRNVTACIAECSPDVFVGMPITHAIRHLYGWGRSSVRINITIGGESLPARRAWGGLTLNDIRSAGESAPPFAAAEMHPDEEAAIIYTSGSTGLPKGAIYTHSNFAAQIEMLSQTFEVEDTELDLPAFPLFALIDFLVGMTAVVPDIRFPRPADIDPALYARTIDQYGVTNMFGSPVVLDKLGRHAEAHDIEFPTLRRVITAGAPAAPDSLERFRRLMPTHAAIFGIYGATESLPIACIDSREILAETREATAQGAGVCIGRPVIGADVRIIQISDTPIPTWDDSLQLAPGIVGEIAVKGPAVTASYIGCDQLNTLAKIRDLDGETIHRTGDVGYFDDLGRLWYCGRKAHRVVTPETTLFTEQIEGVFNQHPHIWRSALVGSTRNRVTIPVLCVELEPHAPADHETIRTELLDLACQNSLTCPITTILFHPNFPTDIRHNSKIVREKLAVWAQKKLFT